VEALHEKGDNIVFNPFNANWEKHAPKKKSKTPLTAAEEAKKRADHLAELIIHGPVPPDNPLLRPKQTESVARRTASRLRSGVIRPDDPNIDPFQLADDLEKDAECRTLVRLVENELVAIDALLYDAYEMLLLRFVDYAKVTYHSEKELAEADPSQPDPDEYMRALEKSQRLDFKSFLNPQLDELDDKRRQKTKTPRRRTAPAGDALTADAEAEPN
jgi:hypothetical protein